MWKREKIGEDFPQKWMKFFSLPKTNHRFVVRQDGLKIFPKNGLHLSNAHFGTLYWDKPWFMENRIARHISERLGIPHLVELLAEGLTGSELNSLLLAVYEKKVEGVRPALLLQQYRTNRFVHPADLDMIGMLE